VLQLFMGFIIIGAVLLLFKAVTESGKQAVAAAPAGGTHA
jgi:hypothetical protein